MTDLSPHFSLEEMIHSQYAERNGIDNTPPEHIIERLRNTANQLEGVRGMLGWPVAISSGYRSPELNKAISGVSNSAHTHGDAVDFTCPKFGTPLDICRAIEDAKIPYDQLIAEGTWVHISFATPQRQEVLTAKFTAQGPVYTKGLVG